MPPIIDFFSLAVATEQPTRGSSSHPAKKRSGRDYFTLQMYRLAVKSDFLPHLVPHLTKHWGICSKKTDQLLSPSRRAQDIPTTMTTECRINYYWDPRCLSSSSEGASVCILPGSIRFDTRIKSTTSNTVR